MARKDMKIDIRFLYEGQFFTSKSAQICYRKGKIHYYRDIDPDTLSKVVLETLLRVEIGLMNVKEIWFLQPGKTIHDGLKYIRGDIDVLDMVQWIGYDKTAHVYVIQGNEASPFALRSPCPTSHPDPIEQHSIEILDFSSDEDEEILGSESSQDEEEFSESEDEDDDLFQQNVDEGVGEFGGEDVLELDNDDATYMDGEIPLDDSDELRSLSESGGERHVRYPEFNPLVDFRKKICLKEGMVFGSNEIFRKALRQFSIENGGDYYYLHNDKTRVSAYCIMKCECAMKHSRKKCTCKEVLCRFKACARKMGADWSFQLKSLVAKHDCGWQHNNTKLTSVWLAERYLEFYRDDPQWKLRGFINVVTRDHRINITYNQAWKARFRAMLMTQGDARVQYGRVWDYAATVKKWITGSSCYVKVCLENPEKPLFQRIYVCFEACKQGFLLGCRPIVGLDGCHLKGVYTGQVLVAVGKDGNENIYPIAYAVVEAERKETWGWFLDILIRDIGESSPTFMSDRQKGLIEALNDVVPGAETRVCVRHMYNNFKTRWPGKTLKDIVWAAARASNTPDFLYAMEEVRKLDEGAYKYLIDANPNTWSRHGFKHHTKSDMLLNNLCESFNSLILPARELPILSMCEWIRRMMMKRFLAKHEGMKKYEGMFTPHAKKRIELAKEESLRSCTPFYGGGDKFEVDHYSRTYVVDLAEKSCGCNKWDITGIPCAHAMSCIMKDRRKIEQFIHPYYTKETYLRAYNKIINPMPGEVQWERTNHLAPDPPRYIVQPGRPRKARRREPGEEIPSKKKRIRIVVKTKCSNCGQQGHYKNRCKNPTRVTQPSVPNKSGGRPKNPNTVYVGSQKRKYKKKNTNNALQPSNTHPTPSAQTAFEGSYDMSQNNIQAENLNIRTQSSFTLEPTNHVQTTPIQTTRSNSTTTRANAPPPNSKKKVIITKSELANALRSSPK